MIAIIDYKAGNLTSVARAVSHIGVECVVTGDAETILNAERIIFPGVGAAGSAMESLKSLGLDKVIASAFAEGKPILGICLGTQIIMAYSEENDTPCLGIIAGKTRAFSKQMPDDDARFLKIPQMGWNRICVKAGHPVLSGLNPEDEFYFVHGYYPSPDHTADIIAETEYGILFPSVIGVNNIIAMQFHPEKSGKPGLRILKNFCEWRPC
ncbi:MAG: imidazole glycerol phosphate synthase subunit HisH [Desulfobacteraceae bacterium IS3]|nr:MAG: imidazole glycerol phosphate synthase subunit HisH [Desulfobacteraceae bacterium IS3]HAO19628.1 imidazole glycerol phosphate synthase subunit HisH [Desulfobacteraceae bacterium]